MSIASEITALTTDRNSIRAVLVDKGVSAASSHGFDSFADDIENIPSGSSSYIVVTSHTGSTVTCDGTAGAEVSGTWTFGGLGVGTHTIVATWGTRTKTQTVLIDTAGVYSVTISFAIYLYNEGDECTAITGGWEQLYSYSGKNKTNKCKTVNVIDLTGITTAHVDGIMVGSYSGGMAFCTGDAISGGSQGTFTQFITDGPSTRAVFSIDISTWSNNTLGVSQNFSTSYTLSDYVLTKNADNMVLSLYSSNGRTYAFRIYKVWLD